MKIVTFKCDKIAARILFLILAFFDVKPVAAQLPNTDIWLLDVKAKEDTILFSNPVNITNRPGYDNQPAFSPDGRYIYFTSIRDEKQSDIYKYDLKAEQISQFTNTPGTSEYSPNVTPDGKNISVVMVEPDSTQRLWQFPLKGGAPQLVMDKVDSIGYYCWINKDSLALVMINEPPVLLVADVHSQQTTKMAGDVSRCLQPDGTGHTFYYMSRTGTGDQHWYFRDSRYDYTRIDVTTSKLEPVMTGKAQDFCTHRYMGNTIIFYASGNRLKAVNYWMHSPMNGALQLDGIKNITRIAVSPDGKKIAVVAE